MRRNLHGIGFIVATTENEKGIKWLIWSDLSPEKEVIIRKNKGVSLYNQIIYWLIHVKNKWWWPIKTA
ncbi:hypothetical protein [Photorhabdus luminescens]|uniref:Uncharacterized protein n=1 Tax=Photorhabdus luminescens subsp. mexicana TaxID=2100167 RepID=A0A4R4IY59_PHOLU|nr:hypothetical protein [Photorhabdus luminescens]TDB45672.1 hypothetical protein C5468_20110 [Photorhabdus luminescens subsp. mexicana]